MMEFGFITQGGGSSHALNIIKQLEKYNERNPGKEILIFKSFCCNY